MPLKSPIMTIAEGYGKTISHVVVGLKTAKGTKQLKLDPSIYDSLLKQKVTSFPRSYDTHA